MLHVLHRYRKPMLWVVTVLLVISFGILGSWSRHLLTEQRKEETASSLANVAGAPITAEEYRNALSSELERRAKQGQSQDYRDLAADGTADQVLQELVNSKLFSAEADKRGLRFTRHFLTEQMKQDPRFQNESGQFDPALWNQFITTAKDINWSAVYVDIERQLGRQVLGVLATASARVLDADVRQRFEDENTKIKVKYVSIEPKIEPTEEQIQATYDADPSRYQHPEKRTAEFIAVSLKPPAPALLDELVERARNGEDFAELAKAYSEGPDAEKGGDMGWVAQELMLPEHQEPLFALEVGAVSDPVEGPNAYYIYKVEEERTDEVTEKRDVRARQIVLRPQLDDEERAAREAEAAEIAEKAKESGDLAATAAAYDLEVRTSGAFSADTVSIDNVPREDGLAFRRGLAELGEGSVSDVIAGRANLYIAKVASITPPVLRPFEEVREDVLRDTIQAIEQSPEHRAEIQRYAMQIAQEAHALKDIKKLCPELDPEIKTAEPFTVKDFRYTGGLFWDPRQVYEAVGKGEPGAFGGPIESFIGQIYFVELVERTPPTEADWEEKWPEQKESIREMLLTTRIRERLNDYLDDLRQRVPQDSMYVNQDYKARILRIDEEPDEEASDESDAAPAAAEDSQETSQEGPAQEETSLDGVS